MITTEIIKTMELQSLIQQHPYTEDFFHMMGIPIKNTQCTLEQYIHHIDPLLIEDLGIEKEGLFQQFFLYMEQMEHIKKGMHLDIQLITILGGRDKSGIPEKTNLYLRPGEVVCIVGPTGSGKSRLLGDIEWMAQKDTPTQRQILINGHAPPPEWRFSSEHKLVAQLSQNMNFVMDIDVCNFIKIHAESRMTDHKDEKIEEIFFHANRLAGEAFRLDTPITSLSGGQSRALMIADTACLSISPIVLIDEIENAGIDRKEALELLVKKDKIILMATHDPILALMGNRRIVIKNGGIHKIIETTEEEKKNLIKLEEIDRAMGKYREMLRRGMTLGNLI